MNNKTKYIAQILFENSLLKYKGQSFEDLFSSLMIQVNDEFIQVKPHGNKGDMKNDGYIKSKGIYYQVFAPDDIFKDNTLQRAIKKLNEDFTGLYLNWNKICPIKEFNFVINSEDVPAPLIHALEQLQQNKEYADISMQFLTTRKLKILFQNLNEEQQQAIVGNTSIDDADAIPILDYHALNSVIKYIIKSKVPTSTPDKLIAPDFDIKIDFNNLGSEVKSILNYSYINSINLDSYFAQNPGQKDLIKEIFKLYYKEARARISNIDEKFEDKIFFDIYQSCLPSTSVDVASRTAIYALIAYYFSTCDIFEEPVKVKE